MTNFTGVEIHYLFKGWITDEAGNELLRVKSELLKNRPGSADFSDEHEGPIRQLNVDPFEKLAVVNAASGWQDYSGTAVLHAELIHPLDTFSIIARATKEVHLDKGVFVDAEGRYATDPNLAKLSISLRYGESFLLEGMSAYLLMENENEYPHCGTYWFTIQQEGTEIYRARVSGDCMPIGKTSLKASDYIVEVNQYEERSLDQPLRLSTFRGDGSYPGPTDGQTIPSYAHAGFDDSQGTYTSQALGLSLAFFEYAEINAVPKSKSDPILEFNEKGSVEELYVEPLHRQRYPLPLDHTRGFFLTRGDLNGGVSTMVFDWNCMSEEDWVSYFGYQHNCAPEEVRKLSTDRLSILYPPRWANMRQQKTMRPPLQVFSLGIHDGDRMILLSMSSVDTAQAAAMLPNYSQPRFLTDPVKLLASVRYNGWRFEAIQDASGELQEIKMITDGEHPTAEQRERTFEQYARYTSLLEKELENRRGATKTVAPSLEDLDLQIAANPDLEPHQLVRFKVLKPGLPDFREYTDYHWETADVKFRYRLIPGKETEPFKMTFHTQYILNEQDSILSRNRSSRGTPIEEAEHSIDIQSDQLYLPFTPNQYVEIHHISHGQLSDREIKIVLGDEYAAPVSEAPAILRRQSAGWEFFLSERLINTGKRGGLCNVMFIRSPRALYKVKVSGGMKSDIKKILNSLQIGGQSLQFQFDDDGQFEKVQVQ